jgi:glycosyltransferase involved in cell wall biosynthesis
MSNPLVSVIVPVYNGERFLRETLESVFSQTYEPLEVIVVNDGSTDDSERILDEYAGRIGCFRQDNAGIAAARNRGISEARGEWLAFLDQDDLWDPRKLEVQLATAREDTAVVHSTLRRIDESCRILSEDRDPRATASLTLADLLVGCEVYILTALVRQKAMEAIGGFDANNRLGTEDYQLWLRLAATGHRFQYIDAVVASYRLHGRNFSSDRVRSHRGDIYAIRRTRREYPRAFGPAERHVYHSRLNRIEFALAWQLYDHGDYGSASRHFWRAVWHRPSDGQAWAHAAVTSLPLRSQVVPRIRSAVMGTSRKGAHDE